MRTTDKPLPLSRRTFLAALTLPALGAAPLAGCGGATINTNNRSADTATRLVAEQTLAAFQMIVSLPKSTYRKGESIPITVTVTNNGGAKAYLQYGWTNSISEVYDGGNAGEFSVQQSGTPVFDSFPNSAPSPYRTTYTASFTVDAGATYTETFEWQQVDVRDHFPLDFAYDPKTFAPNTASPGQYQITVRSNLLYYSVPLPGDIISERMVLPAAEFPPFNILIEP